MLKPILRTIRREQPGITGLETAIILIAFVVVASVFAYTVLSAGIFSSEKSKEAIGSGLSGTTSAMELSGTVVGQDTDGDGDVDTIEFNLKSVLGQDSAIDLSVTTDTDGDGVLSDETTKIHTTVISYFDRDTVIADVAWTKSGLGKNDGDNLLEAGEKFHIIVDLRGLPTDNQLGSYDTFTIEIKPSSGAVVIFQKTIPQVPSAVMTLN